MNLLFTITFLFLPLNGLKRVKHFIIFFFYTYFIFYIFSFYPFAFLFLFFFHSNYTAIGSFLFSMCSLSLFP